MECESYDCKIAKAVKVQDSWPKFMLNVKIQNKNKNVQMSNCLSGFSGVPCKNSTGNSSLNSYNNESLSSFRLKVQGDEADDDIVSTTHQVTTEFDDDADGQNVMKATSKNWYTPTNTADSDLKDFLSRPVNIASYSNNVGVVFSQYFDPWTLYFSTSNIKYKLHNYAFIRCDLKLKVVINGSPFYYGAYMLSYDPLYNMLESAPTDSGGDLAIPFSQKPSAWIYPQDCSGCEMSIPYLNISEWLPIHGTIGSAKLLQMGRANIRSVALLDFATSGAASNITIEVFCWAENVQLSGLTVDLAVQGKDEYHNGPISKVASSIARASGLLSNVPVIGSYMTSTSMVSKTVADIAASFGYTKVPVIDKIEPFKNLPFHGLATSDQADVTEKLTLDSKNELCIDNRCIGDIQENPLLISNFCKRSSYLTQFAWGNPDAPSTLLWNSYVTPSMSKKTAGTGQDLINGTPMFLCNNMFEYWRGDIIFDFKIVCTPYHRGRLRFSWDPVGDVANIPSNTQSVFNHIQDITENTFVSIRIPYIQRTSYLKTVSVFDDMYSGIALPADSSDTVNGILTVRVMNELTSPLATADVTVLVFVRAADNIEFAAPKEISDKINYFTVQGDIQDEVTMGAPSNVDENVNLVYMGETIISLRELLQRCNHHISWNDVIPTSQSEFHYNYMSRRPLYRGFDTNGVHNATGPVSASTKSFNFVTNTPYHLISSCFLGERGSFTWKLNVDALQYKSISAGRCREILSAAKYNPSHAVFNINVNKSIAAAEFSIKKKTAFGTSLMNQKTNTGVSVNAPMYSIYTMLDTSPATRNLGNTNTATTTDTITFDWITHEESGHAEIDYDMNTFYFQVGPDYSPVFFLNVPTLYIYDPPTAV
jgi:hypothetical protein